MEPSAPLSRPFVPSPARLLPLWLLALLCVSLPCAGAETTPVPEDHAFGHGALITPIGRLSHAEALAIQPDGKLVAAGYTTTTDDGDYDFALVRYNPDGTLDPTFGNGTGTVITTFDGLNSDYAADLAIQPDGKLVVAGSALARYNPDGSLDTTFGNGTGSVEVMGHMLQALALQSDGGLVTTGQAILRYHPDGTVDTHFNDGAIFVFHPLMQVGSALVVQPDDKVVVAWEAISKYASDIALARFNADGTLDLSFGDRGTGTIIVAGGDLLAVDVADLALQPDGKLVVATERRQYHEDQPASELDFALVRYNPDGTLDTSFGSGTGYVATPISPYDDVISAIAIQPDGKLVVGGYSAYPESTELALVRYNADGSLDAGFGAGGILATAPSGGDKQVNALAIQSDGQVTLAGAYREASVSEHFALARFNADGSLDTTFGNRADPVLAGTLNGSDSLR